MKKRIATTLLGVAAAMSASTITNTLPKTVDTSTQSVETAKPQSQKPSPANDQAPAQEPQRRNAGNSSTTDEFFPAIGGGRRRFRGFSRYGRGRYYRPTKGKPTTNKLIRSHRTRRAHRRSKR